MAPRPPAERFLGLVEPNVAGCWIWQGTEKAGGYGGFTLPGPRSVFAHRWAYGFWNGAIPAGYQIDHLCRVRRCVNPDHLEAVTQAENNRRAGEARTHCKHGHRYTRESTIVDKQGWRSCRTCHNERRNERRRIARAAA